ncbi:MAG TPA: GLUG motif-containing protein, partial [Rhodocyclaceae bacterium]|nr:GLUG motif-containing protein [Rhodocyclaceae bacterium]
MRHSARAQLLRRTAVCLAVALCFGDPVAYANPTGAQIAHGQVSLNQQGGVLSITNSPSAIINWQDFSIGANETVRFIQQSSASSVLNRVTGQDPSQILGALQSNGRVFLINPNGILFGQGARVDVAGLVASTLNLSNSDFLANRLTFTPAPLARGIDNQGRLDAASGGQIYLIAPDISNSGIINSPQGEIILAAGKGVQLVDTGAPGLRVEITAPGNKAVNLGQIISTSGRINIFGALVSQKGAISASSAVAEGGKIFLRATRHLEIAGDSRTTADGTKGGEIIAKVEDAGQIGGTLAGRGILSAEGNGSAGSGGFVETSAAKLDVDGLSVRTRGGTWLIDPHDFTIGANGDISGASLSANLGSGSVVILSSQGSNAQGNGDINVNEPISWNANTLTLTAARDININAVMTASGTSALTMNTATANGSDAAVAGGTVKVGFNPDGSFKGRVDFPGRSGTGFLTINGIAYTVIDNLGGASSTTGTDLQGIRGDLSGHYALGTDIDLSPSSNWNWNGSVFQGFSPLGGMSGDFTGSFDGLGHAMTGLAINRPAANYVGLFGSINVSATVRNVALVGGSVIGRNETGALAGLNGGNVANSYATATVTGTGSDTGGLVGWNSGFITESHASGTVNGSDMVGGITGWNEGSVIKSFATGNVIGGNSSAQLGGLVGWNDGTVQDSYASGNVTGGNASAEMGGLAGANYGTVSSSYATGSVTGGSGSETLGGLVGWNEGSIGNSHASGPVTGTSNIGGLIGCNGNGYDVSNSHYDIDTVFINNGHYVTVGGIYHNQYQDWINHDKSLNIGSYLGAPDGGGYYTIGTLQGMKDLLGFVGNPAYKFRLSADIDLAGAPGLYFPFLGAAEFDGAGHVIANLNINLPNDGLGLFGEVPQTTLLKNVGVTGSVSGNGFLGGLVGSNTGAITNSYANVAINGSISSLGGLVGWNYGSVASSYASGSISGSDNSLNLGGLVGSNAGNIANSYASGSVNGGNGSYHLGGLVGWSNGSITNSYA